MQYPGEHLIPGQIGHFLVLLAFICSMVAAVSFWRAGKSIDGAAGWLRIARLAFLVETIGVIGTFVTLYIIVSTHLNEYYFAWNHSSRSLQPRYLLACIWEDQSGSFLLWSIWHCVLGWILISRKGKWEAPVMSVINVAQACIGTMLLGIYFFHQRVGSEPFILLRHQLAGAPFLSNPNYLAFPQIREGNDLNALLQNYWMVIHPPILFLGFASTIVPFAFAWAGLSRKDHDWTRIALPWAGFSAAILGTGIMMGAAWAYESLSFGGYWAWDPVENASLVPWLVLVAGLHTNLVYRNSGYSLRATYAFYLLSFVLVLYATFLTRSGILGDTSVHAFTGADMNTQLALFVLVFFLPALWLFIKRRKDIPSVAKEESSYSREFWMFMGSLVLVLSAILIIAKTSVPVVNKVFGTNMAAPEDPVFAYNQVQVFIAIMLGLLTAFAQYLKYKDTPKQVFWRKLLPATVIAAALATLVFIFGRIGYDKRGAGFLIAIHLAVFAAIYAVVANAGYIWSGLNGKLKAAGASVAHVGFGLALLGILISSSNKKVLSWNTTGFSTINQADSKENPAENVTLFKGVRTDMGDYHVTYLRDTSNSVDRKRYFQVLFEPKNGGESFSVYPDVLKNNKGGEGYMANPASRHYFSHDIFSYITSWLEGSKEDTATFHPVSLRVGDTAFYSGGILVLHRVIPDTLGSGRLQPGESGLLLDMTAISKNGRRYPLSPSIAVAGNTARVIPDSVTAQGLTVRFNRILNDQQGRLEIGVKESGNRQDLLTLKVYQFPYINLLWLGVVIMVIGFVMSVVRRIVTLRTKRSA